MRRLKTTDVFAGMRLIKAAGMRDEVVRIALKVREKGEAAIREEIGAELIWGIVEGLASVGAEQKAYEFVSGPLEMDVEAVKDIHPLEWKKIYEEYMKVEDAEGWKNFFNAVANLMS